MRVLHVYKKYLPESQGGVEETIRQICRATQVYGVSNRVLTLSADTGEGVLEREEAEVIRYRQDLEIASCGISLSALAHFRQQARQADIVHYHFPWPFADLLHLLGDVQAPAVVTYHSDIVRQRLLGRLYRPLMHWFLGRVSSIVATSPNYFATSEPLSHYAEKVEVIPIGLDEESYPPLDEPRRAELREEVGEGFFLFVGVLRYYKGLHILLEAVAGTSLPVVIVGSGPVEGELRSQARRLGLTNVQFLGQVTNAEKMALMALARAVVFPSYLRSEAFGVTLVEGAMQGRSLISTEIGTGTTFVNRDGETGLVVPPADPRRLREAMERLAANPGWAEVLGQGARERYEHLFQGDLMGQHYTKLYRRLLPSYSLEARLDAFSK